MLDAYVEEMPVIQAEERLWEIEKLAFARAPWDEAEAQRRNAFQQRLVAIVNRHRAEYDTDEQGRQILIGYTAVKNWFNYWLSQG